MAGTSPRLKRGVFRYGAKDGLFVRGDLSREGDNKQALNVKLSTQVVTVSGGAATFTVTAARLNKKNILGLTVRVLTPITGAGLTTINWGDGVDADRYGAAITTTVGTTIDFSNATADPREFLVAGAGNVVLTAAAGVLSAGTFRLDVWHEDLTAPAN
jgi:hypothetical protein